MSKSPNKVCAVYTIYALLLYLIHIDDEEIDSTKYILNYTFPDGFSNRLKSCTVYHLPDSIKNKWWKDWYSYYRFQKDKLPKLSKDTELYMQDHDGWTQVYARYHKYTFIEDGPGICSIVTSLGHTDRQLENKRRMSLNLKERIKDIFRRPLIRLLYGSVFKHSFADNSNCIKLLLTRNDECSYLDGKQKIILPELNAELWTTFSKYKQKRILEIFDVSPLDIGEIRDKRIIILTQPLYEYIGDKEHLDIYKKIISQYPAEKIIIKTHPKDNFNYTMHFPGIKTFDKPIPMELFNMLGLNVETAATVYSNSICTFQCEKHWFGTEISKKLNDTIGHIHQPEYTKLVNL